jgi:hypothetical protein
MPRLLLLIALTLAGALALGCAGADGRRTPTPLTLPGPTACVPPASAPAVAPGLGGIQAGGLLVGLHASLRYFDDRGLCRLTRTGRALGARTLREDLRWPAIERARGVRGWAGTDRIVTAAAREGLLVLPVLGNGTPAWARGEQAAAYGRFVAAVVARYGPGGAFWREHPELPGAAAPTFFELWNEPYGPTNPARLPVRTYATFIERAIPAGRAANRRARFLVAAEHRPGPVDWTAALLRLAPSLAGADGVSVHAYGAVPSPASGGSREPGNDTAVTRVEGVRAELVAAGLSRLPLWITEAGASTCQGGPDCVTAAVQARDLDRLFRLARTRWRPYVRALVVYALQDLAGEPRSDKESSFGLFRADGHAKPARAVFARRARALVTTP